MADIEGMIGKLVKVIKDDPNILSELQSDPSGVVSKILGESISGDTANSLISGLLSKAGDSANGISADGLMSELAGGGGGETLSNLLSGIIGGSGSSSDDKGGATGNVMNDLTGGDGKVDAGDILNVAEDLFGGKK